MKLPKTSSRGDQTRELLLSAATEVFGRDGFHASSTRSIARHAGVNQALIGYHFGGKEGLYLAVFERIAEQMSAQLLPVLAELEVEVGSIEATADNCAGACVDCIDKIFTALLQALGQGDRAREWGRLVVREQLDPTPAFDILYNNVLGHMLQLLGAIVAKARGLTPDSESCRLEALTALSQIMFVVMARATAMRQMDWQEIAAEQLDAVRRQALANIYAQFTGARRQ